MLAMLAKANPYLGIEELDMTMVYLLFAAIGAIFAMMGLFRVMAKVRENRRVKKSSWRTFNKIAKVKGLSKVEVQTLSGMVLKSRIQRPTQILGSLQLYDRTLDKAIDRGLISDADQSLLDGVREKLRRAEVKWDGRTNRRQFERADCVFEVQAYVVTKQSIDEEIKSSYEETDSKFVTAVADLVGEMSTVGCRGLNLSAGGMSVLLPDKVQVKEKDYLQFVVGDGDPPFAIDGMLVRVIAVETMEDQHQIRLNVGFLPYDQDLRRAIIHRVYETQSEPVSTSKKGQKKKKSAPVKTALDEDSRIQSEPGDGMSEESEAEMNHEGTPV